MPHSVSSEPRSPAQNADADAAMADDNNPHEEPIQEAAPADDAAALGEDVAMANGEAGAAAPSAGASVSVASTDPDAMTDDVAAESAAEAAPEAPEKKTTVDTSLENLFDDDDDLIEEAPKSSPPQTAAIGPDMALLDASDPEVMRSFYQRLFPWRYLFQWLNHGPKPTNDFGHREFAFTLQNDAYLRYQSYPTADLLRKDVLRLLPSRFEIGPVYSANPRDRKTLAGSAAFRPVAKELCFDIDLTDYDDVRTCCGKANICRRCWQFITMAVEVVDVALRDDFGFRHILWVYSGRRGAHAWVCDKRARLLDDHRRRAIAGYLEVVRGGSQGGKKVSIRRAPRAAGGGSGGGGGAAAAAAAVTAAATATATDMHPHLARSLERLRPHFQNDVLRDQDPWGGEDSEDEFGDADLLADDDVPQTAQGARKNADRLLQLLPDKTLNEALRRKWAAAPGRSSTLKWADIDAVAKTGVSPHLDARALLEAKQDIVLEYTYPRLDIEVSKKLNHLLKSPFVVHPGTGRVCVPIDPRHLDRFDPLAVPTVQSLLQEIDSWPVDGSTATVAAQNGAGNDTATSAEATKPLQDWEKTSLKPYIEQFRSFVLALVQDEAAANVKIKREHEEAGLEF